MWIRRSSCRLYEASKAVSFRWKHNTVVRLQLHCLSVAVGACWSVFQVQAVGWMRSANGYTTIPWICEAVSFEWI